MEKREKILIVKFNLHNDQDKIKWDHLQKKQNRHSYIKDLILLDLLCDVFNNPDLLRQARNGNGKVESDES